MELAKKICAVIDMQGFFIEKVFYPRELAIVNDKYKLCFEIDCDIPNDLRIKNFKHFSFQQHQIHNIPIEKVIPDKTLRVFKNSQLKHILFDIYCRIRSEDKYLFAIKNQQLAKLLDVYEIPYINLEKVTIGNEICPTLLNFDKYSKHKKGFCLLHFMLNNSAHGINIRCSLRKSEKIWEWLINKIISDQLVSDIFNNLTSIESASNII